MQQRASEVAGEPEPALRALDSAQLVVQEPEGEAVPELQQAQAAG